MANARGRPDPRRVRSSPRRVGDALDRLMGSMKAPSVDVVQTVFNRWEEIVGADLARHTRPSSLDGGTLTVTADDSAWASEFRWLEGEVVSRLADVTQSDRIDAIVVKVRRR